MGTSVQHCRYREIGVDFLVLEGGKEVCGWVECGEVRLMSFKKRDEMGAYLEFGNRSWGTGSLS